MAGGLQALRLLRPAASPALLPAASFASEVPTLELGPSEWRNKLSHESSPLVNDCELVLVE